ncbi:hypothetical protein M1146_06590 [Patescibacteria group bacterium]|nr:hypothetical protein [Patescibacteria group bacterium]
MVIEKIFHEFYSKNNKPGFNPVKTPTYPAQLAAVKIVLLFLLKSYSTVNGFKNSIPQSIVRM